MNNVICVHNLLESVLSWKIFFYVEYVFGARIVCIINLIISAVIISHDYMQLHLLDNEIE